MGHGSCPGRIVSNAISGLVCGLVGSALYVGGSGVLRGLKTEATLANMRAVPYMGAQCGVLVAVYSTCDCLLKGVRGTDDKLNVIASGAATGALFGARRGPNVMAINAAVGVVIALICDQ